MATFLRSLVATFPHRRRSRPHRCAVVVASILTGKPSLHHTPLSPRRRVIGLYSGAQCPRRRVVVASSPRRRWRVRRHRVIAEPSSRLRLVAPCSPVASHRRQCRPSVHAGALPHHRCRCPSSPHPFYHHLPVLTSPRRRAAFLEAERVAGRDRAGTSGARTCCSCVARGTSSRSPCASWSGAPCWRLRHRRVGPGSLVDQARLRSWPRAVTPKMQKTPETKWITPGLTLGERTGWRQTSLSRAVGGRGDKLQLASLVFPRDSGRGGHKMGCRQVLENFQLLRADTATVIWTLRHGYFKQVQTSCTGGRLPRSSEHCPRMQLLTYN